jgi:replicative DNA helicase
MNVPDLKGNRVNEVSESSRCMKALAVELECPVIVLSQFNRDYSKRSADDKRPVLSDLRDSGAVEQDSDIIAFLYRESGYDRSSSDMNTEVIVAKNRSGEVGIFDLQFHSQICLFSEYK